MNYEIAKKLEDAGFPPTKSGKVVMSKTQETMFLHGAPIADAGYVGVPTLSELIEAVGEPFESLSRINHEKFSDPFDWVAFSEFAMGKSNSPEEAVANPWLSLNEKKP